MASKAQIVSLAEAGLSRPDIAERTGVTESYISQVLNEDTIKRKTLQAQLDVLDERTRRDKKYDDIEDTLLDKMASVASALYKPQDILRALVTINRAERRGATSQQLAELANNRQSTVIALHLPERVTTKIVKSSTQEVLSVNGRNLITKDSRLLLQEMQVSGNGSGESSYALGAPNNPVPISRISFDDSPPDSDLELEDFLDVSSSNSNSNPHSTLAHSEPQNETRSAPPEAQGSHEDFSIEDFPGNPPATQDDGIQLMDSL